MVEVVAEVVVQVLEEGVVLHQRAAARILREAEVLDREEVTSHGSRELQKLSELSESWRKNSGSKLEHRWQQDRRPRLHLHLHLYDEYD